jgi:hypothetical protein
MFEALRDPLMIDDRFTRTRDDRFARTMDDDFAEMKDVSCTGTHRPFVPIPFVLFSVSFSPKGRISIECLLKKYLNKPRRPYCPEDLSSALQIKDLHLVSGSPVL